MSDEINVDMVSISGPVVLKVVEKGGPIRLEEVNLKIPQGE